MATKSFKDICIEYAHQLGKGLPLTAPEMCNALVMYLNQQVVDMQNMVQTALNAVKDVQNDLAEGEYATLGANNAFRGNNSFSQTIQANGGITINGENVATENDFPSYTEFSGVTYSQEEGAEISYGNNKINLPIIGGDNINIGADSTGTHLQISAENVVTTNTYQVISSKAFRSDTDTIPVIQVINPNNNKNTAYELACIYRHEPENSVVDYQIYFPHKPGTFALLSDIPDLNNYIGVFNILHGSSGSGVAVHDTTINSPYSRYSYNKIYLYGNSNLLLYTLNLPNKNGTIATLDDIKSSSVTKYFTRIIFHNTDEDTQYILFSCITDTDLSANTSYQNVVDLLYSLGATTTDTALPCTGKTISGGIVVGVYTDGVNIIVFDTDNSTEDLTMTSEIKFISK